MCWYGSVGYDGVVISPSNSMSSMGSATTFGTGGRTPVGDRPALKAQTSFFTQTFAEPLEETSTDAGGRGGLMAKHLEEIASGKGAAAASSSTAEEKNTRRSLIETKPQGEGTGGEKSPFLSPTAPAAPGAATGAASPSAEPVASAPSPPTPAAAPVAAAGRDAQAERPMYGRSSSKRWPPRAPKSAPSVPAAEASAPEPTQAEPSAKVQPTASTADEEKEETGRAAPRDSFFAPVPQEINSVHAAVESGAPAAVPAVLVHMDHEAAVFELTARNCSGLRDASSIGTGNVYGNSSGDDDAELETVIMLAALSGNLDMFHTVLEAMKEKLPTAKQVDDMIGMTDEGRSLVVAAAEGGSLEIFEEVLGLLGGKEAAAGNMSTLEAGCLIKMAARSGSIEVFSTVRDMLAEDGKIVHSMKAAANSGARWVNVFVEAAGSGSGEMVDAVVAVMVEVLPRDSVMDTITACKGPWRTTALMAAAESRSTASVKAVMNAISAIDDSTSDGDDENFDNMRLTGEPPSPFSADSLSHSKASAGRGAPTIKTDGLGPNWASWKDRSLAGTLKRWDSIASMRSPPPPNPQYLRERMIVAKNVRGHTALTCAANSGVLDNVVIVSEAMGKFLSAYQMTDALSSSLSTGCNNLSLPVEDARLSVLAYLLQHGAKPTNKGLLRLCNLVKFPRLKESLLGAISSADNPFIPGMNLSVACTMATRRAMEGEKRRLASMQAAIDELLLEVLEHMPQTVKGFKGEMRDCSAIFEPETVISRFHGYQGPLHVVLSKRQQMETYCTIPLVLDFMSRKFTKGLPSLRDTEGVLLNNTSFTEPGQTLYGDGLLAEGRVFFFGMALQRSYAGGTLSSITYFPGARFIIAGLLSRPGSYYKVPALRMCLDLVTYILMMIIFGGFVILHDAGDTFDWMEIVFTMYIFGGILTEFREILDDPWEYMRDQWNLLDVASLTLLLGGVIQRMYGQVDDQSSRALYALSAPLAFARILFFVQILPSQGPIIQVMFSMTGLLAKFGMIMLLVMLGFVTSFYSLYKETTTYGVVWKAIFRATLGETDYFDDFSGTTFDGVATALLVVYLVLLTIMMLNLLVAVLSTAHAKVDADAGLEYKAPVVVWQTSGDKSRGGRIARMLLVIFACAVGAPFWHLVMWVRGGVAGVRRTMRALGCCCCCGRGRGGGAKRVGGRTPTASMTVRGFPATTVAEGAEHDMEKVVPIVLQEADGALATSELQIFLDDPMSDPAVRRDEETRATTVEHIKLLRNRLEATTKEHMDGLQAYLLKTAGDISRQLEESGAGGRGSHGGGGGGAAAAARGRVGAAPQDEDDDENRDVGGWEAGSRGAEELRQIVGARFSELDASLEAREGALQERMGTMIDERLGALTKKLDLVLSARETGAP
ncbi:Ankyrin Repeat Transient Receptor Potential Channel [Ectocarpus siliculosus]|uniref:Ankyrin Repeat Transient Receptor Potential Channel n=1 Tax=Ectocarpus siliculosus TaxID=2880 RepID=D8LT30_ECTSI|nr:Ankyrin Repeat Transient Receptor Potential Channel [Ectocarpus siliculosus]|eukprot:CBN75304.1 Ankyrin Repeat Transient Receptor Potential Channel [Ectocarpus siliculosus]